MAELGDWRLLAEAHIIRRATCWNRHAEEKKQEMLARAPILVSCSAAMAGFAVPLRHAYLTLGGWGWQGATYPSRKVSDRHARFHAGQSPSSSSAGASMTLRLLGPAAS